MESTDQAVAVLLDGLQAQEAASENKRQSYYKCDQCDPIHSSPRTADFICRVVARDTSDLDRNPSVLTLVLLSGSEKRKRCTHQETSLIGNDVSPLGRVVHALTDSGRGHVPYRDSKLTYLLRDSFGGAARTAFIAVIGPDEDEVSMTSVRFLARVAMIKNRP